MKHLKKIFEAQQGIPSLHPKGRTPKEYYPAMEINWDDFAKALEKKFGAEPFSPSERGGGRPSTLTKEEGDNPYNWWLEEDLTVEEMVDFVRDYFDSPAGSGDDEDF